MKFTLLFGILIGITIESVVEAIKNTTLSHLYDDCVLMLSLLLLFYSFRIAWKMQKEYRIKNRKKAIE